MEPITDVRDISRIAYGFLASRALFTALELGVFDQLSRGPRALDEAAADLGIVRERLLILLTTLVSQGIVAKDGDRYANSPAAQSFLVRGADRFYGDYLSVVNGRFLYPYVVELTRALRGEARTRSFYDVYYSDPENAAAFTRAQHMGSLGPAAVLARRVDLAGCRRLLDVGGGSGAFTLALCRRWPELSATILDFPPTVDVARQYASEAGLSSRIAHVGGNALDVTWPASQDVVLTSYVWSAVGRADIEALAMKAREVLPPDGLFLVHDFMVNGDLTGPPIAAWHLLASTLDNPSSVCLTPETVAQVLQNRGFRLESSSDLVPGITSLVVARRGQ